MTSEQSCPDKRDYFPTDTEISQELSEDNKQPSRKLQKWSESLEADKNKPTSPTGLYLSLDEQTSNNSNNWTPQAMFEHHEKKYNFKSTYDELEYTTPLPALSDDQLLKAARIENEIIREGQHDEEDYDRTEEELFSKVMRPNKLNYYRTGKQMKRKEFERKTDKREVHPEAVGLPEWRQAAFSKFKSTSKEKDEQTEEIQTEKTTSKQTGKQESEENTEKTTLKTVESIPPSSPIPDTHTPSKEQENILFNKTELDSSTNQERTPSARNKTSVQKKKDAIEYIESHSREEIKKNFISFSQDLTPRISTIAKTSQESTNSNADLTSNSYSNLEIFTAPVSKSVPNLESNSNDNIRCQEATTKPDMVYSVVTRDTASAGIEVSENWELETTDACGQTQIKYEQTCSEHSSVQSQLTPQHSHTLSHDSQDSGVLDSEYPPSTESDTNNITSESENCKQQQQQQQGSTLNPQAEEFRFDMSKLSDSILSDPGYLRSLKKGTSQKYSKQPNASMRGRGNIGANSSQRGDRVGSGIGYNKKQEMTSPGGVGGKSRGYADSIVGPTGQVLAKRGSRKSGRYKTNKHQLYKPGYEMEQQLYAIPASQFQVLPNPNNVFYQPTGHIQHLQQSAKTGQIPQQMQLGSHPTVPPHHSVQAMQTMHNPQIAMQQVSYPGFALSAQMPEDPQAIVPHQSTQIIFGPDGIPLTYLPPTQTDYQHYTTQNPHPYPQIPQTETPQQYIIPQYIPANTAHHQHGYTMQIETQQPSQVIYPTYPGQPSHHHQANIIQLQSNAKANMY